MTADCPFAEFVEAHQSNYKTSARLAYKRVVIHVTDGHPSARGTAEFFATAKDDRDPPKASSAHFVVGQAPLEVLQCVRLKDIAYHCPGANTDGVGVEHAARTPKEWSSTDPGLPMTPDQYALSAKLVAWLLKAAGLPVDRDHVLGHNEADPTTTHTDCPTGCFDFDVYMPLVQAAYDALAGA